MTTVDVRIERVGSGDRLFLHNGMWGPATGVLLAVSRRSKATPVTIVTAVMVRKRLLLVMLVVATGVRANILPPGTYPFRTYGSESGLGSLAAMRLAQDNDGYLWVATQDGAYRYDGTRFERFGLGEGLPSTFISSLRAVRDGSVWVGTAAGWLYYAGVALACDLV